MIRTSKQVLNASRDTYKFENIITSINRLFQSYPLVFHAKGGIELKDLLFSCPLKPIVSMNNKLIELNFRMIESYMPEILLAFCLCSDEKKTINEVITTLVDEGFPTSVITAPKIFLQHKIVTFIEAMLFADLFNEAWDGKYQEGKCYVFKNGAELKYYTSYNIRVLLRDFLDRIKVCSTNRLTNKFHTYTLSFIIIH